MIKSILAFFVVIFSVMGPVYSDCCYTTTVLYTTRQKCNDIGGGRIRSVLMGQTVGGIGDSFAQMSVIQVNALLNNCETYICGNGLPANDIYCGVGDCNFVGCKCDSGCIPGDAIQNFKQNYGHMATDIWEKPSYMIAAKTIFG